MEELKKIFGDKALTYAQFCTLMAKSDLIPQEQLDAFRAENEHMQIQAAVDDALTRAGARNLRAAKALIDMDALTMDAQGALTGLDIAAIKNENPYMFSQKKQRDEGDAFRTGQQHDSIARMFSAGRRQ